MAVQETFLRLKIERNWSGVTYNTYRKSLISYFQVLTDAGIVLSNPLRKVRKCAEALTDQPKLDREQVKPLFDQLGRHTK